MLSHFLEIPFWIHTSSLEIFGCFAVVLHLFVVQHRFLSIVFIKNLFPCICYKDFSCELVRMISGCVQIKSAMVKILFLSECSDIPVVLGKNHHCLCLILVQLFSQLNSWLFLPMIQPGHLIMDDMVLMLSVQLQISSKTF